MSNSPATSRLRFAFAKFGRAIHAAVRTLRTRNVNLALLLLAFASPSRAQDPPAILDIQVGFKPLSPGPRTPTHKVGLWTPVFVEVDPGLPQGEGKPLEISLESEDSVDNATLSRFPVPTIPNRGTLVRGTIKPGHVRNDLRIALHPKDSPKTLATATIQPRTSGLRDYLYLSLGAKLDDLAEALTLKENTDGKSTAKPNRFAVYETDADYLPDSWMGYDGIDLVILDLSNPEFIANHKKWFRPLKEWVSRGGRLIVALDPSLAAKPDIHEAKSLGAIEAWAGLHDKPFPARGEPAVPISKHLYNEFLASDPEILVQLEDPLSRTRTLPLIARTSYGMGSVTTIAFPLATGPFAKWSGRVEFLRTLVDQLGPRFVPAEQSPGEILGRSADITDWGARLERDLDNFNVSARTFASVACFMLLYIGVVSAGDYLILRRMFRRLDSTWITLPLIVLGVGGLAYMELDRQGDPGNLINQLELLDVHAEMPYGTGSSTIWTGVRSDAIRSLDASIEQESKDGIRAIAWNGRPDDGPAGMGRAGGLALSQKSYGIDFDRSNFTTRLRNVPIAERGTRSFLAQCNGVPDGYLLAPFLLADIGSSRKDDESPTLIEAKMSYHPRDHSLKASGTITNHLPFDLEDAALFVFDRVYPLPGGIKKGETKIAIKATDSGLLPGEWRDKTDADRPTTRHGVYDPGYALRSIMFHERLDPSLRIGNHLFRRLDWSWRLRDDPRVINVPLSVLGTREAILIGRARVERPGIVLRQGETEIAAKRTCDTYVRAIVPLKPLP